MPFKQKRDTRFLDDKVVTDGQSMDHPSAFEMLSNDLFMIEAKITTKGGGIFTGVIHPNRSSLELGYIYFTNRDLLGAKRFQIGLMVTQEVTEWGELSPNDDNYWFLTFSQIDVIDVTALIWEDRSRFEHWNILTATEDATHSIELNENAVWTLLQTMDEVYLKDGSSFAGSTASLVPRPDGSSVVQITGEDGTEIIASDLPSLSEYTWIISPLVVSINKNQKAIFCSVDGPAGKPPCYYAERVSPTY